MLDVRSSGTISGFSGWGATNFHVLRAKGAFCDCEIFDNVAERSKLKDRQVVPYLSYFVSDSLQVLWSNFGRSVFG